MRLAPERRRFLPYGKAHRLSETVENRLGGGSGRAPDTGPDPGRKRREGRGGRGGEKRKGKTD